MFATSPEELETLLEDAVLLGDSTAVTGLFRTGAVVITGQRIAGPEQALVELASLSYFASHRPITVRHGLALAIGEFAVNVSSRGPDGAWRLAATILWPSSSGSREQSG